MADVYVIHLDRHEWAQRIRAALNQILTDRGLPARSLQFSEGTLGSVSEPAVCLFLGSLAARSNEQCIRQVDEAFHLQIPIVPIVDSHYRFEEQVVPRLEPIHGCVLDGPYTIELIAHTVLRQVGLSEVQRRVFISYRRPEGCAMADQVFDVLNRYGFEVFLDRFSGEPGEYFQERLKEDLEDKAFLVFLESPDAHRSPWVKYEIVYALDHHMGLIALKWPNTTQEIPELTGVDRVTRVRLSSSQVVRRGNQQYLLDSSYIPNFLDLVEQEHARTFSLRRQYLLGSVQAHANELGLLFHELPDWVAIIETPARGRRRVLQIVPRPAEVRGLFELDRNRQPHAFGGTLIHTGTCLARDRYELLEWTTENRDLNMFDYTVCRRFLEEFGRGRY